MPNAEPVKTNVCVVGCGAIGSLHTELYTNETQIGTLGVIELSEQVRQTLGMDDAITTFKTLEESFEVPFDVYDICLPTHLHAQAIAAIMVNTDARIICEKPLTLSLDEYTALIHSQPNIVDRVVCAHVERFNEPFIAAEQWARQHQGPYTMRFTRRTKKPEQQGWFSDPKLGGDIVLDLGIHDIDASIWFSKSELASIISHVTDQDQESFEIKLQDGSRCHFDLGWDIPATSEIGIENNFSIKTATGSFTYDGLTETITVNEVTKSVNPRFPQAYQNEIHGSIQMPHKKDSHFPTHNEIKHGLTIVEAITKERTNASN